MKNVSKGQWLVQIIVMIIATLIIFLVAGCTVYKTPKMHITSVLAVTAEGDTLKLPIDVIRPIYNYNTYPTNRYPVHPNYFYYSPWRNNNTYEGGSSYNNNSNSNVSPSVSTPSVKPSGSVVTPPPTPVNPRKN
tara:strand:+ start:156 stop:557 length:402 start_codon:yes stop_codon:yes gene_type:complete